MREVTRTERIGEELGPIDWSHPMIAEVEAQHGGRELIAMLREAEKTPDLFRATTDGGWPRVGWGDVLRVVMYDGWPYWQPTPTVVSTGFYGSRHDSFSAISEIRRKEAGHA